MDLLQRHAMHGRLGLRQAAEDAQGQVALPRRQLAAGQDRLDLGQEAVFAFDGGFDVQIGGREAALAHLFDLQRDRQAERGDAGADRLQRHPRVEQRRHRHVAADAAETVEMRHTHSKSLLGGILRRTAT